ncbi:MAG TPA: C-terminal binding protein [Acidimicrobiia bacterium]|jgi:D-3-phosphoglycerate dehydrogenase|nr:C-terminal binding protein [Acidimicrobiia bacterium]
MAKYKVVVSDQVFPSVEIERELLSEIEAELTVASGDIDDVLEIASDADAILNTYLPWGPDAIARLENCKIIARYGIGVDNVDLSAAADAGIVVTNVPDYSVEEVATHALALILASLRKIVQANEGVRTGGWGIDDFRPIRRLSTLTVGLIGYGRIARKIAAPLEALGAHIISHDPYLSSGPGLPPLVAVDDLLATADIVSLHVPLTDETRGLIGEPELAQMKDGAILINTSRGPLIDLDALGMALANGKLAAAGLDVFDVEPLDPARIEGIPNLIATPHMAYYSEEALGESQRKAATQVVKVLTGEQPDYQVN